MTLIKNIMRPSMAMQLPSSGVVSSSFLESDSSSPFIRPSSILSSLDYPPVFWPLHGGGYLAILLPLLIPRIRSIRRWKLAVTSLLLLLAMQEYGLTRRLQIDFRAMIKSKWFTVDGVVLNWKGLELDDVKGDDAALRLHLSLHLFHGFGANTLSWSPFLDGLSRDNWLSSPSSLSSTAELEETFQSRRVSVIATAHDIPGFGFSPRPHTFDVKRLFPTIYRPLWNARAGLELGWLVTGSIEESTDNAEGPNAEESWQQEGDQSLSKDQTQKVFVGHSMGAIPALCAACAEAHGRENVSLILVGPAFTFTRAELSALGGMQDALPSMPPEEVIARVWQGVEGSKLPPIGPKRTPPFNEATMAKLLSLRALILAPRLLLREILRFPQRLATLVDLISKYSVALGIRRFTHTNWFWFRGLGSVWGVFRPLLSDDVFRYKLASMARGFDFDFMRFVIAQSVMYRPSSTTQTHQEAGMPAPTSPPIEALNAGGFRSSELVPGISQALALGSLASVGPNCRVYLVEGERDTISSAVAMKRIIDQRFPNLPEGRVQLIQAPKLGHLAHEEDPSCVFERLKDEIVRLSR